MTGKPRFQVCVTNGWLEPLATHPASASRTRVSPCSAMVCDRLADRVIHDFRTENHPTGRFGGNQSMVSRRAHVLALAHEKADRLEAEYATKEAVA